VFGELCRLVRFRDDLGRCLNAAWRHVALPGGPGLYDDRRAENPAGLAPITRLGRGQGWQYHGLDMDRWSCAAPGAVTRLPVPVWPDLASSAPTGGTQRGHSRSLAEQGVPDSRSEPGKLAKIAASGVSDQQSVQLLAAGARVGSEQPERSAKARRGRLPGGRAGAG
jgi:hypothetical protein